MNCKIKFFPLKWFMSSTQYKNQMEKSQKQFSNIIVPVRFCSSNRKTEVKILAPISRNKLDPVRM